MEKLYCSNCDNKTNQELIFKDANFSPLKILLRNEEWTEINEAYVITATIWKLSKCKGCEQINIEITSRTNPDGSDDKVLHFPKKIIRKTPDWIDIIPIKYLKIMNEIYQAIDYDLYTLALIGTRTLLDQFITDKIGDIGTFKQKINALQQNNFITQNKIQVIEVALDAGNAAAHRGYTPDKKTLFQVLDIVENLLHSELVDRPINDIRTKIPNKRSNN